MREHFQLIVNALDIGLDSATETPDFQFKEVLTELPIILEGFMPPSAVRAIVSIDGTRYEVVVKPTDGAQFPYPQHQAKAGDEA